MALFGDFGKFFQAAVAPIVVPTKAVVSLVQGKSPAAVISESKRDLAPYIGGARTVLAAVGVGANRPQIDAPQTAPGPQQMETQYTYQPQQFFQPTQFAGGSYDPNLGGGYPTWDSSTGFQATPGTPSWATYSEGMAEDWAANW